MSILIKGMAMPTTCLECWNCDRNFRDEEGEPIKDWMCLLLFEQVGDSTKTRLNGCPLIEIHDHGDLVDRDAYLDKLRTVEDEGMWAYGAAASISTMPVVIPAERSEDGET